MPRRRPASAAPSATLMGLPAPSAFLASFHLLPSVHSPPVDNDDDTTCLLRVIKAGHSGPPLPAGRGTLQATCCPGANWLICCLSPP
jgi:hypothetical protein